MVLDLPSFDDQYFSTMRETLWIAADLKAFGQVLVNLIYALYCTVVVQTGYLALDAFLATAEVFRTECGPRIS